MALPTQVNPAANRTACAPYNFIPLPEKVVTVADDARDLPSHGVFNDSKESHTGYFDVTLETRSPLYVRCALELEKFLTQERGDDEIKNTPHFFYTDDRNKPVIPSSSLRGMLRSLLEIVSYGKVEKVTDKNLVYRAVGDPTALGDWYRKQVLGPNKDTFPNMYFDYPSPQLKGGYLCQDGADWAIRPAVEHCGESLIHVDYTRWPWNGGWGTDSVWVTPAGRTDPNRGPGRNLVLNLALAPAVQAHTTGSSPPAGMVEATVVQSQGLQNAKHMHCAIYAPDTTATLIPIPPDMWSDYEEDREMKRGITPRGLSTDGDPLFYLVRKVNGKDELVFFGTTMMFRLPYRRSINHHIPPSLRRPLDIDYADALFGFIRAPKDFPDPKVAPPQGDARRGYAGRVSVTDACLEDCQNNIWLDDSPTPRTIRPKILSSPKPTSFQHYLVQEDERPRDVSHYDSPQKDAEGRDRGKRSVIRGHKRYWHHHDDVRAADLRAEDAAGTQHTRMNPLGSGVKFKFRVYFENLSDRELGALCWILQPLGVGGQEYCHSLGMGKPLGMGAVKLKATLHENSRTKRYSKLFDVSGWETGMTGPGKDLSADRLEWEKLIKPFEDHILAELNPQPACTHLWGLKRIGMLLKMMQWPGHRPVVPAAPNNRVLNGVPNTRYMSIRINGVPPNQRNEYSGRPILPDPSAFGDLTGNAVPTVDDTAWNDEEPDPAVIDASETLQPGITPNPTPPVKSTIGDFIAPDPPINGEEEAAITPPPKFYNEGEKVSVKVVKKSGMQGTVELQDGTRLSNVTVGMCNTNDTIKMRVTQASNGIIKKLTR